MRIERFFHIRQPNSLHGGATVRAVGDTETKEVEVQVAYCSYKDQFNRKVGRATTKDESSDVKTKKREKITLHLDQLPLKLMRVAHQVVRHDPNVSRKMRPETQLWRTDWSFAKRYFVPSMQQQGQQQPE